MNWEPKNWVFALFLYLALTLVVGYGVFLFGGDCIGCFENTMGASSLIGLLIFVLCLIWKSGQKILAIALFAVPILYIVILFCCCGKCSEKEPKVNQICEVLQGSCSNSWKISVSNIQVNCRQGEAK